MAYGVVTGQVPEVELPPIPESFPIGGIIIWSGASTAIPSGWHLCDGTSGTPDLRNKFIVGAGSEYKVGDTGGSKQVTLTVEQLAEHKHEMVQPTFSQGSSYADLNISTYPLYVGKTNAGNPRTIEIKVNPTHELYLKMNTAGGSQPHENRPPYYALCYIMKIK